MAGTEDRGQEGRDYAEEFAAFAAQVALEQLPSEVIEKAKLDLVDTLACAMGGVSAPGVPELARMVSDWGGKPEATVWCLGARLPAHHAAWINGTMAHARDFDDTHDAAVLHAGVSVIPAALAAAEAYPDATGADVLAGIIVGLELISRLGVATTVGIIESGFMYTSLFGHFAATACASRVARLTPAQMVNALGVAYSQAAGTHQVTRDGALTKRVQPGFAAKTALISVAMTKAGISGALRTFEGRDGLFHSYLKGRYEPDRLRMGLGERFDFLDLSFKPYPCCRFDHTAIDAALIIRQQIGVDRLSEITSITAYVNNQAREAVGTPIHLRRIPETIVQAQFSIPFTVACALKNGAVSLSDFTKVGIRDEAVIEISKKVSVEVDPEIEREWSRSVSPTRLVVNLGGETVEVRVDTPLGDASRPMLPADFDLKIWSCAEISGLAWPGDCAERLLDAVNQLGAARDVTQLVAVVSLGA
jgi:2-methylcitrate dehydratase PrpD